MSQLPGTTWRCSHGHSAVDHPHCWLAYRKSIDSAKVGFLDIETSQLDADFGIMLSWALKTRGSDEIFSDVITQKELFTRFKGTDEYIQDYRIVKALVTKLYDYDWIVTYYGTEFDIKFIRTKALYWHRFDPSVNFPPYGTIYHYDCYYTAKGKVKLHSNRLDSVATYFDLAKKTAVEPQYWRRALAGDKESLEWILKHNKQDVITLEEAFNLLSSHVHISKKSL